MATLLELRAAGELVKYDADLPARAQETRLLYLLPQVRDRIQNEIAALESHFGNEINPLEDLVAFLEIFCRGEPIQVDRQVRCLTHLGDGVWELKTRDIRLFGWFPTQDCFVCSAIDDASRTKLLKLYRPYAQECVRRRNQLGLDGPKFLAGDDPHVVLSNFNYPAP